MQPKPCKLPELVTVQDAHANLAEAMLKHVDTTSAEMGVFRDFLKSIEDHTDSPMTDAVFKALKDIPELVKKLYKDGAHIAPQQDADALYWAMRGRQALRSGGMSSLVACAHHFPCSSTMMWGGGMAIRKWPLPEEPEAFEGQLTEEKLCATGCVIPNPVGYRDIDCWDIGCWDIGC